MPLFGRRKSKYEQAAELLTEGEVEQAITMLEDLLEVKPEHTNARVTLAVALLERQDEATMENPDTKRAFMLLDEAAEMAPTDPVSYFNRGVCLRKLGKPEAALDSFQAALDIDEQLPLAVLHMAEINYELEQWDEAIELARRALVMDPGFEASMEWVRDALRQAGRLDAGKNVIEKEASPDG
jgi:tetratricopeptide (TPR) repeat protein